MNKSVRFLYYIAIVERERDESSRMTSRLGNDVVVCRRCWNSTVDGYLLNIWNSRERERQGIIWGMIQTDSATINENGGVRDLWHRNFFDGRNR